MHALRARALECTRCDLHLTGTPVVWGEGDARSGVMVIGQGPGEQEARARRPFVGPAGRVLDEALAQVGIRRERLWLTNGIKHWATTVNPRGTRVNRPPRVGELRACHLWLEGELGIIRPRLIVCLGGPAVQALTGEEVKIGEARGRWFQGPDGVDVLPTFHPSYLLRLRAADSAAHAATMALWLDDLRTVVERARDAGIDLT
jgi:DNA polymerase